MPTPSAELTSASCDHPQAESPALPRGRARALRTCGHGAESRGSALRVEAKGCAPGKVSVVVTTPSPRRRDQPGGRSQPGLRGRQPPSWPPLARADTGPVSNPKGTPWPGTTRGLTHTTAEPHPTAGEMVGPQRPAGDPPTLPFLATERTAFSFSEESGEKGKEETGNSYKRRDKKVK